MRYRGSLGVTRKSLDQLKHLPKLGKIKYVRGYFYQSKYGPRAAVLVRGANGSCRFGGFSWGYGGEGPRGLQQLLIKLGVESTTIEKVVYNTPWTEEIKEHWRIEFLAGHTWLPTRQAACRKVSDALALIREYNLAGCP